MTDLATAAEQAKSSRRGFLKGFGIIGATLAASPVFAMTKLDRKEKKSGFLKKKWKENGITFLEYELPPTVQALFRKGRRGRAVYCPIHNLDKEVVSTDIINKTVRKRGKPSRESYVNQMINTIELHRRDRENKWTEAYCYIVNITGRPELLGIMINQERMPIETDAYTVYR